MKKALLFFGMCVCFISTIMLGMTSAEAKIYIEGDEKVQLRFSPKIDEYGNLYFGDINNRWGIAEKYNYLDQGLAFNLYPGISFFSKFEVSGSVYSVNVENYLEYSYEGNDLTGYISVDANEDSAITLSSTRTSNRIIPSYSGMENSKLAASGYLGSLAQIAHNMENSVSEKGVTNVHPVLKFDVALIEGDETSNFTSGMNVNYMYPRKNPAGGDTGYQVYEKFNYACKTFKEFEIPLSSHYIEISKLFIDVDSDSIDVPTTYTFKNFRIALERFVPINRAEYDELLLLDGIGQVLAQRIIDYRTENNENFDSIDDLQKVKGIGPATIKKIKDQGAARVYDYFN